MSKSSSSNKKNTDLPHLLRSLSKHVQKDDGNDDGGVYEACNDIISKLTEAVDDKGDKKVSKVLSIEAKEHVDLIRKTLSSATKTFRLRKRKAQASANKAQWDTLLQQTEALSKKLSAIAKDSAAAADDYDSSSDNDDGGRNKDDDVKGELPKSTGAYLSRLQQQKKELYKNPPAMPPPEIVIESGEWVGEPKRNKKTGELIFVCGGGNDNESVLKKLLRDFKPNLTPAQVLQGGAFGGTYFRSIHSAVTNQRYDGKEVVRNTCPQSWIVGMDIKTQLISQKYSVDVNKYGVKCGGSLGMWESSGWISNVDPYGWFQWYCNFYRGRRCSDDVRQIQRWLKLAGPKGRFRSQLCNKILRCASGNPNHHVSDATISPVIRQTLHHWGLEINETVFKQHCRRVGY